MTGHISNTQKKSTQLIKEISPNDEIYLHHFSKIQDETKAKNYYFSSGQNVATNLVAYLRTETNIEPSQSSILDFAAGYGRVTRWLVQDFNSVTVSELEQDMIDFHKTWFGVDGFLSGTHPQSLRNHPEKYSVIWVFSLFTHLPEETWSNWLEALTGLLAKDGYIFFSCHSYELFEKINPARVRNREDKPEEFVFWESNETKGRISTDIYGLNIVTKNFVDKTIKGIPNLELAKHFKMGEFDRYHDIYVGRRCS